MACGSFDKRQISGGDVNGLTGRESKGWLQKKVLADLTRGKASPPPAFGSEAKTRPPGGAKPLSPQKVQNKILTDWGSCTSKA
jgi:hypothetical protein